MVDIENIVFRLAKEAAVNCDSNVTVYSDYVDAPDKFPCVYVIEDSNTTYQQSMDASHEEHHATLMYSVNVYADNAGNKKSVAKKLMSAVDKVMITLGFSRITCGPMPNLDRTIYRISARYQAVVGEEIYDAVHDRYVNTIYKS